MNRAVRLRERIFRAPMKGITEFRSSQWKNPEYRNEWKEMLI